jgi:hypothetical protein
MQAAVTCLESCSLPLLVLTVLTVLARAVGFEDSSSRFFGAFC